MKKVLRTIGALLLVTALVISLIPVSGVEAASASDFQMEGSKLVKYVGAAEVVSIPDDVRSIGEEAFAGNSNIVKVTINDKCKSIEYGAFKNCVGLHSVIVGNDVTDIASAAFSNDPSLKNVSLGNSVKKIGSGAFAGDTSLTNMTVSSGNTHLKFQDNVLYDDDMETLICMLPSDENFEFVMPQSVNEINGYAFWGNNALTNVTLGSGLISVPEYAFSNCKNLRQVTIPLPIRSIDSKAFEDCVNLSSVKCPDSMTYISDSAFDGCPKVTINATAGSYAYEFGQKLVKDLIEEIEYEDTEASSVVTQEIVPSPGADGSSNAQVSIDSQSSADTITSSNGSDLSDGTLSDANKPSEIDASKTEGTVTVTPAPEAKYFNGVINGADVVTYTYYAADDEPDGPLMGQSSVVGGRALVFIDNNINVRNSDLPSTDVITSIDLDSVIEPSTKNSDLELAEVSDKESDVKGHDDSKDNKQDPGFDAPREPEKVDIGELIAQSAGKGIDFPKFTIVGTKVASQSFYKDSTLTSYDIPENITSIGDFAFSRSSLNSIKIPDGVTSIGYGAFYHCDNLAEVSIPSSVKSIGSNAFDKTAFVNNYPGDFVIVGDGILIAYKGSDSVVTIPEGVKLIADGAFRDHMGITALNLADTLEVIGEDAFNGCHNLKTVNRGDNVTTIGANAFKGTALSTVTIQPSVVSIGIGAFDLDGGTDTVAFLGENIPVLTYGTASSRLANSDDRTYAFGDMSKAIVPQNASNLLGTVLEAGKYGFHGIVINELGNTVSDNSVGVSHRNDGVLRIDANCGMLDASKVDANIVGDDGSYTLRITDSQNAKEAINLAYGELYGGRQPSNLVGFDMTLMDDTDTVNIKKLGKQVVEVTLELPSTVNKCNLHVVSLDDDGQLEAVPYSWNEEATLITMRCSHFSPYGFYNYEGANASVDKEGDRIKDDTPDTGDLLHPKWFLVIGCVSLALLLFLLTMKKKENY